MIDLEWCVDFSIDFSELLLGAVGLIMISSAAGMEKRQKRYYTVFLLLPMLVALAQLILKLMEAYGSVPEVAQTVRELRNLLYYPLLPVTVAFLLYCCGEPLRGSRAFWTVCALRASELGSSILFRLTVPPYSITPEGAILFRPTILVQALITIAFVTVMIVILVRRWKKLTKFQRFFFVACYLTPSSWMILLLEVFILREQNRRYLQQKDELIRQKDELARQKTQVAVLQMRPHFIYNTLMSIYYLCREDPPKAQQVILDFSRYLKTNYTAIVSEDNVPFSEELEHTRAYLAVEKARFEDKLYVEFDTPVTVFKLPPLTLQPIVENSVKHGVSPGFDPLYLSIATQDSEQGVTIVVEDTGPGYAPSDDNEPHIALANIRERLEAMCGGTLEIAPRKEGGTKVLIFVPWQKA